MKTKLQKPENSELMNRCNY